MESEMATFPQPSLLSGYQEKSKLLQVYMLSGIEYPPVTGINNSFEVIGFDEMTSQKMSTMTMKSGQKRIHHEPKKLCKWVILLKRCCLQSRGDKN
ncbi:hypothetical protein AVEN_171381-1 [Araneus ventricosus]|uniref:Uncharacterized protein n=1 Tax=Araneus ventricosus TaxID=182803 RepID=A0A4Y2FD70_ARAVE|nr:hypothetical protein AVEN_171381-1 [Araneus ventricosus]